MLARLMMRRYEAQYRFDRNPATWELFFKSYRSFEEKLSALLVDDQVKAKLGDLVKGYSSTLAQWNRQSQNIQKSVSEIIETSQQLAPQSQAIIPWRSTGLKSGRCLGPIAEPHPHSSSGAAAVLIGSVQLAGGLQHHAPAQRAHRAMTSRRRRHVCVDPGDGGQDELGAMARTVTVSRDTMIERERLAAGEGRPIASASSAPTRSAPPSRASKCRSTRRSAKYAKPPAAWK